MVMDDVAAGVEAVAMDIPMEGFRVRRTRQRIKRTSEWCGEIKEETNKCF